MGLVITLALYVKPSIKQNHIRLYYLLENHAYGAGRNKGPYIAQHFHRKPQNGYN